MNESTETTIKQGAITRLSITARERTTRGYRAPEKLMPTHRLAHFLNWAAQAHPGVYYPYNLILKAIMGYGRLPSVGSEEVRLLRQRLSAAGEILRETYKREVVTLHGVGARASIGDADHMVSLLPKRAKRLASARKSLVRTAHMIDLSKVPDTEEYKAIKAWAKTSVGALVRQIESPEFTAKLLPPVLSAEKAAK